MQAHFLFFAGAMLIGFGNGLFGVATLTCAMAFPASTHAGRGLALGAWGAAQATGAGLSIFIGGATRDIINHLSMDGYLGAALQSQATGYSVVYHLELALLFVTLIALGPLFKRRPMNKVEAKPHIGLSDFPT
jgi:PUCC protein.